MTAWIDHTALTSKGQTSKKATRLADLHERRREHQGQFWTPSWVSEGIWSLLSNSFRDKHHYTAFDNSVGSGSLLAHAPADRVNVYGCDPDTRCIEHLSESAATAGFADYSFVADGMENITVQNMSIAVINPPFSVHLESPNLSPLSCTTFGRFGPNSSAISQHYSLEQALDGAGVVAALLPTTMDPVARASRRLVAIYRLPRETFLSEGANVSTAVYLFNSHGGTDVVEHDVTPNQLWPLCPLAIPSVGDLRARKFSQHGVSNGEPVISTPVTGGTEVSLHHHNRRIILKFTCGLTEARVMNALLVQGAPLVPGQRLPKGIKYTGSGRFLLDTYLSMDDPDAGLALFLDEIRHAGGSPVLSDTFAGFWKRIKRKTQRALVPFRHVVKRQKQAQTTLVARKMTLLSITDFTSPPLGKGTRLAANNIGGEFEVSYQGYTTRLNAQDVRARFTIESDTGTGEQLEWTVVNEGKNAAYPDLYHQASKELTRAGVDFLWPVQFDSVAEHLVNSTGAAMAWQQGCGKARSCVALCLTGGPHNLIVVESGLVNEMRKELIFKLELDPSLWQVIENAADAKALRKINVVSYNRLKSIVPGTRSKTIAKLLRRRVTTVCADEGGLLANDRTLQSSAIKQLSPRRLYIADGTLLANYAREILPIAGYTIGNSTAVQPYGNHNLPHMTEAIRTSSQPATRGMQAFRDQFMVVDWATHEFNEDLKSGAKREIPTIRNVEAFRSFLAPLVQRRLAKEPDFAIYHTCPDWSAETHNIEWDLEHFKHYLNTAVNFSEWFRREKADKEYQGKNINFIEVLARLNAVFHACNQPHAESKGSMALYGQITSKQRYVLNLIRQRVKAGRKVILYARSPSVVYRFEKELTRLGIKSVVFTGEQNIESRTAELDRKFREGDCQVLLSTYVGQRGLNLPEGKSVIFYNREFSGDCENQAIYRTQRPDQTDEVDVNYIHLPGIDEYMAQVVEWKTRSADAALDWGDGISQSDVYRHMDDWLERFCTETLAMSSRDAADFLNVSQVA